MGLIGSTGDHGALLGRAAILARVQKQEVFDPRTFSEANLRGAAYDLRLARDFLIAPDGRAYGPKQARREFTGKALMLRPGDIAYVASRERLRLPWDLAANILPKYALIQEGVLVFCGGIVDPGYGLERAGRLGWRPSEEERLHFLVANMSGQSVSLIPGEERIAALQFFAVEPVARGQREPPRSAVETWEERAAEPERLVTAVDFFTRTTEQTRELRARVEHIDVTNERVVVFGVYVMAAALITGTVAALVAIFSTRHRVIKIELQDPGTLTSKGFALLVGGLLVAMLICVCVVTLARAIVALRWRIPPTPARRSGLVDRLRRR